MLNSLREQNPTKSDNQPSDHIHFLDPLSNNWSLVFFLFITGSPRNNNIIAPNNVQKPKTVERQKVNPCRPTCPTTETTERKDQPTSTRRPPTGPKKNSPAIKTTRLNGIYLNQPVSQPSSRPSSSSYNNRASERSLARAARTYQGQPEERRDTECEPSSLSVAGIANRFLPAALRCKFNVPGTMPSGMTPHRSRSTYSACVNPAYYYYGYDDPVWPAF